MSKRAVAQRSCGFHVCLLMMRKFITSIVPLNMERNYFTSVKKRKLGRNWSCCTFYDALGPKTLIQFCSAYNSIPFYFGDDWKCLEVSMQWSVKELLSFNFRKSLFHYIIKIYVKRQSNWCLNARIHETTFFFS